MVDSAELFDQIVISFGSLKWIDFIVSKAAYGFCQEFAFCQMWKITDGSKQLIYFYTRTIYYLKIAAENHPLIFIKDFIARTRKKLMYKNIGILFGSIIVI